LQSEDILFSSVTTLRGCALASLLIILLFQ
jgi:hypothetical protein